MDLLQAIKDDDVEMAEWIVKQQLEKDKTNVNLWLKLALIELQLPFEDYESALKCIEEIYQLSPNHLEALIFRSRNSLALFSNNERLSKTIK